MEMFFYGAIAFLSVLVLTLFFSRNKAIAGKKEAERELSKVMGDLENVYSEVNNTQEELNAKYREIKAGEDKIKKLAYEDSLTGLPNKSAFMEMLDHTLLTLRKGEEAGVIYIDLDDFKEINDFWGHTNGDELILDVSHRLRQNLDEDDYIARMSGDGDGFIILSQNIRELSDFDEKLKRLENAFRFPFITSFGQAVINISMGVTLAPKDGVKTDALIKNVSVALTEAKRLGKDNYCYYSEDIAARELETIELRSSLSVAVRNDSFIIKYSPIIDLTSKECDTVRAKLLWDRKDKGIWNAGKFIKFAEKTGLAVSIGINYLKGLCAEMKSFPDKKVIVTLTKRLFLNGEFRDKMYEIIGESGLDCSRFILEIEEKVLTENFADSILMMNEMIGKGFTFMAGKYGSGKMSMDILRDMPLEQVGISAPSVFDLHDGEEAKKYLTLVVSVIKELGGLPIFTDISDSIAEDYIMALGGRMVEGELYGGLLTAKEVTEYRVL